MHFTATLEQRPLATARLIWLAQMQHSRFKYQEHSPDFGWKREKNANINTSVQDLLERIPTPPSVETLGCTFLYSCMHNEFLLSNSTIAQLSS